MWRRPALILVLLASCSKQPQSDLQYIADARSAAAEWALVNEQANQGKLTPTYVESMHRWLRQQLETDTGALSEPNATYAAEMNALLQQRDDAEPSVLRPHADRLKQIEDALESA